MTRPNPGFQIVEHTADTGIRGYAGDLSELFRVMAEGLFTVIADPTGVLPSLERTLELEGYPETELLHEWLENLNTLHQIHNELYVNFAPRVSAHRLTAAVKGEPIDLLRHELRVEVKAVTWHDLMCRKTPTGYEAFVLVDI